MEGINALPKRGSRSHSLLIMRNKRGSEEKAGYISLSAEGMKAVDIAEGLKETLKGSEFIGGVGTHWLVIQNKAVKKEKAGYIPISGGKRTATEIAEEIRRFI